MARNVSTGRKIGTTALAWFVGLVIFFPILWTFLTSFKTELQVTCMWPCPPELKEDALSEGIDGLDVDWEPEVRI